MKVVKDSGHLKEASAYGDSGVSGEEGESLVFGDRGRAAFGSEPSQPDAGGAVA